MKLIDSLILFVFLCKQWRTIFTLPHNPKASKCDYCQKPINIAYQQTHINERGYSIILNKQIRNSIKTI